MNGRLARASLATAAGCLLAANLLAASTPPPRPAVQILDEMIEHSRAARAALQQERMTGGGPWKPDMDRTADELAHSVGELARDGNTSGGPVTGYGLRILIHRLRSATEPRQAIESAEELIDALSFVRSEYRIAAETPAPPSAPTVSRPNPRKIAVEILRGAEFRHSGRPNLFDRWLNRMIANAVARLKGIFETAALHRASTFAYVLLWALYGIGGGVVIWWVHRTWSPRRRLRENALPTGSAAVVWLAPELHLAEAESLARQGRFADALRSYFLMMLATLEQRHWVARNRCWTNWEYLRALRTRVRDDSVCGRMRELTSLYDRIHYGGSPCDEQGFDAFRRSVDDLLSGLPDASI